MTFKDFTSVTRRPSLWHEVGGKECIRTCSSVAFEKIGQRFVVPYMRLFCLFVLTRLCIKLEV
jgi:hypothetical protein